MSYKKIEKVTDEFWENEIIEINRELIDEFLEQAHYASATLKQYKSSLRIFARWVHENVKPKGEAGITDLKPRDAMKYQNWLIGKGLGDNAVKFKRSTVSKLCSHIEVFYGDEYPDFRQIFTKAVPSVSKTAKKEKIPLTTKEINTIISELEKREEWQKIAYVCFTYSTGCRREESRQLLAEVAEYDYYIDQKGNKKNYYLTHKIRAKGRGSEGKPRNFSFDDKAMQAIRKWIEVRKEIFPNDNCPYIFVSKTKTGYKQLSANTFNLWCKQFSEYVGGKAVHPHLFRSSRATNAVVEEGKDIKKVQKLLGHDSSETTEIYVVRDDSDDLDDLF